LQLFRVVKTAYQHSYCFECRGGSVSTVNGLWAGRPSLNSRQGLGFFSHYHVQISSGAHPPYYPMGTGVFFPEDRVARA